MQVLLRAYIRSDRQAIIPFLEGVNYGSFEDSQSLLASAGMEPELIVLYSTHHKHDLVALSYFCEVGDCTDPLPFVPVNAFVDGAAEASC